MNKIKNSEKETSKMSPAAIHAVQNGLDYARECLITHNSNLGRTTLKNRTWAERMEEDIRHMEGTLTALRLCPNVL